ncbi:hypothetical protein IV203_012793 [Nitzschia inconspicua]|uniref:SWIM-type domain-containing protein n=1 Tax=Nitzschia inconspicua TaxID=303405 RepID=A0A9K3K7U5_9STRA|nr:hypothetical protein IV203_012757 [Nitzschia inconspicua]KAG7350040.1 hypothetical protein IV203_012637 [Nitzschia inconspicua]KAG7373698.1 hypothetical protein IV203_012793 [Nitzschia inconspicua]
MKSIVTLDEYQSGFDTNSNTYLEGTNYGVKYCENRVLPNNSQAKATKGACFTNGREYVAAGNGCVGDLHFLAMSANTKNNRMKRSCFEYERNGIPCKHICHIALNFATNFESFTQHHSVDIRFWTANSLYAVVLDLLELNEVELDIRNKLITARWKSPQPPAAPVSTKIF